VIDRVNDNKFDLVSKYSPAGDQAQAINKITKDFQAERAAGSSPSASQPKCWARGGEEWQRDGNTGGDLRDFGL